MALNIFLAQGTKTYMPSWIIPVNFLGDDICVEDLVESVMEVQGTRGSCPGHQGGDGLQIQ